MRHSRHDALVRKFKPLGHNDDGEYADVEFEDNSPKAVRRLWIASINHDDPEASYALLRRSETDDGALDRDCPVSKSLAGLLIEKAVHYLEQIE
jgi:hypothetical protein